MKSTLEAAKTARVHRLFSARNYVNRADKAEKFSGNSYYGHCVLEVPHSGA